MASRDDDQPFAAALSAALLLPAPAFVFTVAMLIPAVGLDPRAAGLAAVILVGLRLSFASTSAAPSVFARHLPRFARIALVAAGVMANTADGPAVKFVAAGLVIAADLVMVPVARWIERRLHRTGRLRATVLDEIDNPVDDTDDHSERPR